jgi:hypothetical protein
MAAASFTGPGGFMTLWGRLRDLRGRVDLGAGNRRRLMATHVLGWAVVLVPLVGPGLAAPTIMLAPTLSAAEPPRFRRSIDRVGVVLVAKGRVAIGRVAIARIIGLR